MVATGSPSPMHPIQRAQLSSIEWAFARGCIADVFTVVCLTKAGPKTVHWGGFVFPALGESAGSRCVIASVAALVTDMVKA